MKYQVVKFDNNTFQVIDVLNRREVCVCANFADLDDAEARANMTAQALNDVKRSKEILAFQKETLTTLENLSALLRDKTVIAFTNDDWEVAFNTLELDAESGGFDADLRKQIRSALHASQEIRLCKIDNLLKRGNALLAKTSKSGKLR
jgi:3-dehydroquinate synthase class II